MSYLDRYKNNKNKDKRKKQSIKYDRWDLQTAKQIRDEVRDYLIAEQELGSKVQTGIEAMNDALFALYKANPEMEDSKDIRPSFKVNHTVIEELMKLSNFQKNRDISIGDPIGTGLACAAMEPELEVLFDKLSEAQKIANDLESLVSEYEELQKSVEEILDETGDDDSEPAKNFQEDVDKINEAMDKLADQISKLEDELNKELSDKQPTINKHLKDAVDNLSSNTEALQQLESWGLQPGGVRKMSAEARIALSKKMKSEKFKQMAEIFGKMQSMAIHEHLHKTDQGSEEIYELEQGAELHRVIPIDMLMLNDEVLVYDWLRKFVERSLVQYSLRGQDSVNKGGIIILEDGSSSMIGTREVWAKGIGLALLKIATIQKRPFSAVNFSGPGTYVHWEFDTSGSILKSVKTYRGNEESFEGIEAVIDYAETSMNGGTNFETPFSVGLDILEYQYQTTGCVNGDIVFLTDGECGMSKDFIKSFKIDQERLGFKVFGIAIQTNPQSEPMNTMCDGNVIGLKQLSDVNDIRPLFSKL